MRPADYGSFPSFAIVHTSCASDDAAEGVVLSFKAYPLGRCYGEPKSELITGLSCAAERAVRGASRRASILANLQPD